MKRMVQKIKNRVGENVKKIGYEGISLTIFLLLFSMILTGNTIRVVANGKSNYETFLEEKESLAELETKNAILRRERAYVASDEYKKLFLRDSYSIAGESEELYRVRDDAKYYDIEKELLDVSEKKDYKDWWDRLFKL